MPLTKELTELQVQFSAGEVVFSEEDTTRDLYVLLRGKLEVLQRGLHLGEIHQEGAFVGEMALLTGQTRSTTIRTVMETIMLKVPPDKLPVLMKNMPDLAMRMAKNLAMTVNNLNKDLYKAWEAMELVKILRETVDKNPNATLSETVPKLFDEVKKRQNNSMVEIAKSYFKSNIFIEPFIAAIKMTLGKVLPLDIQAGIQQGGEIPPQEKICGVDFHGVMSGTFIFMTSAEKLQKVGKQLFGDKLTDTMADDALMELARLILEHVKEAVPGLHLQLSTPEIMKSFNIDDKDFIGIKLKTNVGFYSWIHLNR